MVRRSIQNLAYKNPQRNMGSLLIVGGAMLVLASLLLLIQPLYTFASPEEEEDCDRCCISVEPDTLFNLGNMNPGDTFERTVIITKIGDLPAYLWMMHEWVSGTPSLGEPGDLYSQIIMTITWGNMVIYSGPMNGLEEPFNISTVAGPIRQGQIMQLTVHVFLPGPETNNEFQGSTLRTRFLFYTECGSETEEPPEPPGTDPPLPPTGGMLSITLVVLGFLLIGVGIVLKRRFVKSEAV